MTALGTPITTHQKIVDEVEHPKKAIPKAPPDREYHAMPGSNKTWIQFKEGSDPEQAMANFTERLNHETYRGGSKMVHTKAVIHAKKKRKC